MTREVVTVAEEASFKEIAATMAGRRVSALHRRRPRGTPVILKLTPW